jgi:hypothetical protein
MSELKLNSSRVIGKTAKGGGRFGTMADAPEKRILAVLRVALVVALILGVVAATDIGTNESPSTIASIKHYR